MSKEAQGTLARRERQIMDVLYASGRATAQDVQDALPDPPSYSTVRALLRVLEGKGHVRHEQDGPRYVFLPVVAREKARRSALRRVLDTFFDGSTEQAVAALLDLQSSKLDPKQLEQLAKLIDKARKEGR